MTSIDTTTAQVQNTFYARQSQDLPIASVGSGVLNLSLLNPGVASAGGIGVGYGPSVGGQRPRNNNFTVEGVDNNNKVVTGPLVFIPNDAVSNFTVLQNQFSPEFGHSSGGQFNTVIQSGTNSFHGRVYEYFQNRNLNAIDAQNARGVAHPTNPAYDNNRFGAQIGGPIVRNKLFFFANYEGNPVNQALANTGCSPTPAGFAALATVQSAFAPANYAAFVQYHTPAAAVDTSGICGTAGKAASTTVTGAGGKTVSVPVGILNIAGTQQLRNQQLTSSVDYNLSNADQLCGRYIYGHVDYTPPSGDPAFFPAFFTVNPVRNQLFTLSEFHTFTSTLMNEFRVGYNRYSNPELDGDKKFGSLAQFPNISIDEFGTNIGPPPNSPQFTIQNLYQAVDNLTWTRGRHDVKVGFEGRKYISPQQFTQRQRGDYFWSTLDNYLHDLAPDDFGERSTGAFLYYGDQYALYGYAKRPRRNARQRVRQVHSSDSTMAGRDGIHEWGGAMTMRDDRT